MLDYFINLSTNRVIKLLCIILFFTVIIQLILSSNQVLKKYGFKNYINSQDFTAYYTAAQMLKYGAGNDLYDINKQEYWQKQFVSKFSSSKNFRPFINPPFVALFYLPFTFLSLNISYLIWFIVNLVILFNICKIFLEKFLQNLNSIKIFTFTLLILSYLPVFYTLISGQISFILLFSLLMVRKDFLTNNKIKTGLWLSILFLKPQYIILPLLFFIFRKEYKIVSVTAFIGGFFSLVSFLLVGHLGIEKYLHFLASILSWQNTNTVVPALEYSWRGFMQLIVQKNDIESIFIYWLLGIMILILLLLYSWKDKARKKIAVFDFQWSIIIIGIILITPYISGQDLSILLLPAALIYYWSRQVKSMKNFHKLVFVLIMTGYFVPIISDYFAYNFHIQLQVIYMAFLLMSLLFIQKNYAKDF